MDIVELRRKACDIRLDVVNLIHNAGCGHIGGDMSEADALVCLYYNHLNCSPERLHDPDRDRFVLSKGHSVETLYCILADKGFFEKDELMNTYSAYGSRFIGHPNNKIPGIEMNSGSLGHGLSVAVGMAKAGKMDGRDYKVYVMIGDGELAEGSIWEGVMSGSHYSLDNLTAFVDRNRLQISGSTERVMAQDFQEERWSAFGWNVISIPGNDMKAIDEAIKEANAYKDKPSVIILNSVKGCGISFIENRPEWHHKTMNEKEYEMAVKELEWERGNC